MVMTRRLSWFGGGQVSPTSRQASAVEVNEKIKERGQGLSASKSREQSRHRKHRRKEEVKKDDVCDTTCPEPLPPARNDSDPSMNSKASSQDPCASSTSKTTAKASPVHKNDRAERSEHNSKPRAPSREQGRVKDVLPKASTRPTASRSSSIQQPLPPPTKPSLFRHETAPMTYHPARPSHRSHRHRSSGKQDGGQQDRRKLPESDSKSESNDNKNYKVKTISTRRPSIGRYSRASSSSANVKGSATRSSTSHPPPPLTSPTSRPPLPTTWQSSSSSKTRSSVSTALPPRSPTSTTKSRVPTSPTTRRRSSTATKPQPTLDCLTCCETLPASKMTTLPCNHSWCHSCIRHIFHSSLTDPAQMPPKCCGGPDNPIPLNSIQNLFTRDFKQRFNRKLLEHETKNRLYCPRKSCGNWIKPKHTKHVDRTSGKKYGLCSRCDMKVCVTCSGKFHPREKECPNDPTLKELKDLAQKEGWQRCYSCKAMVELKAGCNHMTCRCGAQFCMLCGTRWRECNCVMFNDEYIDQIRDQERNGGGGGVAWGGWAFGWGGGAAAADGGDRGRENMPGAWQNLMWDALLRADEMRDRNRRNRGRDDFDDSDEDGDPRLPRRDRDDHSPQRPPRQERARRGSDPPPRAGRRDAWPEDLHRRRVIDPDEQLARWLHEAELMGEEDLADRGPQRRQDRVTAAAGRERLWRERAHAVLTDEEFQGDRNREADELVREMARRRRRAAGAGINVMDFLHESDDDDDDDSEDETPLARRVREAGR